MLRFTTRGAMTLTLVPLLLASPSADGQRLVEGEDGEMMMEIEEIVVVGSRRQTRSTTDTLAPVDILTSEILATRGGIDMDEMLRTFIPAYNIATQPTSDASALTPVNGQIGLRAPESRDLLVADVAGVEHT